MEKALILAEKPSVAKDIAAALGGFREAERNVFERDDLIVSCAAGHLVGIAAPESIARQVPVIPEQFDLVVREKAEDRLKAVLKQIRRKDVGMLINACDAGREGELIFRLIVEFAQSRKPISRMWLQSMTPQAIRDGFAVMRTDAQMQPLAAAARARAEADWIVGINGSRLCKLLTGDQTPVGRVQTPTLMIVVAREEAIRRFQARTFHEVHLKVGLQAGEFVARWQNPEVNRAEGDPLERIWDATLAQAIAKRCGIRGLDSVADETQPSKRVAPTLFDLTTLQREANRLYGLSAKDTSDLAQLLYQTHKVLTYPRTDAKALPEDYLPTVTQIMGALTESGYAKEANPILEQNWIRPTKRIFDNSKISDHFAIIPTGDTPSGLSQAEQAIYDLVVRRMLAAFYPDAEFAVTTRTVQLGDDRFVARGKVLVTPGWLAVYKGETSDGKSDRKEDSASLPVLQPGEAGRHAGVSIAQGETRAPARYNEATLLSAMEHAGEEVADEALREAMSERGLGTPATRAAHIEGLIADGYLERQKKQLVPTARAFALKALLSKLRAEALLSPALTGEWEARLKAIERGEMSVEGFRPPIVAFVREFAQRTKVAEAAQLAGNPPCPTCGQPLRRVSGSKGPFWSCSAYPHCTATLPDENGRPGKPKPKAQVSQHKCACGAGLINRTGIAKKSGKPYSLWSCSQYPKCTRSYNDKGGQPDYADRPV
ncbi:DNA topoisomerase [Burkholderia pyrrocinia]|uniref:DNA topoisomerase n=1 Tax=Burkholderia pyrrocinia TaxID=60550 RepID=UPI001BCBEEB3|nr:DNA topoisomerase [Burkholderia pyrrocinia]QVN18975.1 topoisomerase DNA-binding C4 zinc finger domain-containing protein [Burkholderia pyrrocinia]